MAGLCLQMRNPGFTMPMVRNLVERNFTPITEYQAMTMMREAPMKFISVCYYNHTCSRIAKAVLPGGDKCNMGTRLVNRQRRPCKSGGMLMVNYEYRVVDQKGDHEIDVECVLTKSRFSVPRLHVERHMHWSQTRTCHSLQGSSVDGALILWDINSPRITPEFIYVAMTRARTLKEVFFVC